MFNLFRSKDVGGTNPMQESIASGIEFIEERNHQPPTEEEYNDHAKSTMKMNLQQTQVVKRTSGQVKLFVDDQDKAVAVRREESSEMYKKD